MTSSFHARPGSPPPPWTLEWVRTAQPCASAASPALPQLEQREEGDRLLRDRQTHDLLLEVEAAAPAEQRAEPFEEDRDRREAERHVRDRDRRRLDREGAQRRCKRLRLLRRHRGLELGRERRRPEPEVAVALDGQPLGQPVRGLLEAPVLRQPAGELLGRLLRIELLEIDVLARRPAPAPSARASDETRTRNSPHASRSSCSRSASSSTKASTMPATSTSASGTSSLRTSVSSRSKGPSNASRSSSSS